MCFFHRSFVFFSFYKSTPLALILISSDHCALCCLASLGYLLCAGSDACRKQSVVFVILKLKSNQLTHSMENLTNDFKWITKHADKYIWVEICVFLHITAILLYPPSIWDGNFLYVTRAEIAAHCCSMLTLWHCVTITWCRETLAVKC